MGDSRLYTTIDHFEDLDRLMQGEEPVVLGFGSSDGASSAESIPDEAMGALARQFEGRPVQFGWIDIDARPGLAHRFAIERGPAFLMCLSGEVLDAVVGRCGSASVAPKVEELLDLSGAESIFSRLVAFARGA